MMPAPTLCKKRKGWGTPDDFVESEVSVAKGGPPANPEYEGEFIPYVRKGVIPIDQLIIDPFKTREHKVWVGKALVPLVYLKNEEILIPASKYEEGIRLLNPTDGKLLH